MAGNRLTRNIPSSLYATDNRDQKYLYDGLHRLKNSTQGTLSAGSITSRNFEQDWTLDQLGNWPTFKERATESDPTWVLNQTRYHNAVNEIAGNGGNSITASPGTNWDDPVYDAAGSFIETTYDAWNRLRTTQRGGFGPGNTYEYDGLGQRIRDDRSGGTTNDRDFYYNDQWQLLAEVKDQTGTPVISLYHWHPFYIDALGVRMRAGDTHFFLQDANFNVTAAVEDSSNNVVERYAYSPYGEVTFLEPDFDPIGASAIGNTHLYTGRERDPETFLQLNRNRFYASWLGRWVSRDPIGYEDSYNSYEYVRSAVLNSVDPTGLWELRCRSVQNTIGIAQHCWVECDGHSYSFLQKPGKIGTPIKDDPDDKGKGKVVASGRNECGCIGWQFTANMNTYPYEALDCNSNYYANKLLKSCGVTARFPRRAFGKDDCDRQKCQFVAEPFPFPPIF